MKKIVITTVAALAIMAAPIAGSASAAAKESTVQQYANKVVYQYSFDGSNWKLVKKSQVPNGKKVTIQSNCNSQVQRPVVQKPQAPVEKPQAPVEKPQAPAEKPQVPVEKPSAPTGGQSNESSGSQLSEFEQQVVDLTNKERAKYGLPALKVDNELSKMAREKSNDMAKNNYFDHNSPTYGSPFDMMKKFGISYRSAGENIAKGQRSPQEVVTAWMNSEGHRANILNKNYTHIGVGYIANGNHWTQEFIGK